VTVHSNVFVQSLQQQGAVQALKTHPEGWLALYHIQHGMVHLISLFGTSSSTRIHIEQGVHPIVPDQWNNSNATLVQLICEISLLNHLFTGGKL